MDRNDLRRRREAVGLSQEDLAEMVGLTGKNRRQTVQRIESGRDALGPRFALLADAALTELERRRRTVPNAEPPTRRRRKEATA